MFEPPILEQLMGVGALLIGFAGAYRHIKLHVLFSFYRSV